MKRLMAVVLFTSAFLCFAVSSAAQNEERFKAHLAPVPMDAAMRQSVTGSGSATAVLAGNKLSITVTFAGLGGPATAARLHRGVATGVRGSAFHDLTISKATSGMLSASFDLTPDQAESLRKGKVYIQISSEKAPDGNLWGWLLR